MPIPVNITNIKGDADTQGFLPYDEYPQNSFEARGLPPPKFAPAKEMRGGSNQLVRTLAWSCDGARIATGYERPAETTSVRLRVWDARSTAAGVTFDGLSASTPLPSSLKTPSPHNGHVTSLAWSTTDPHILVSGCAPKNVSGGVVAVWDVRKPAGPLAMFKIPGDVLNITFHPSGNHFAVSSSKHATDCVRFFWQVEREGKTVWEQRSDIQIDGGRDEEINSLQFWAGGDAVMAVSNDGSLNAWRYPVTERPGLVLPEEETSAREEDERPAKRSRLASPTSQSAPAEPETESTEKPAGEGVEEDDEAEAEEPREGGRESEDPEPQDQPEAAEAGGENGEEGDGAGEATGDPARSGEATGANGTPAPAEEEGTPAPAEDAGETSTPAPQEDVEMVDASAPPTRPPSAPASAAVSEAPSAVPTRQASPAKSPPKLAEDKASDDAEKAAKEAAAKAAAALELERKKHRQLERVLKKTPHVGSLLALAVERNGKYVAVGGQDARLSVLDTADLIVQRTFDTPTAAIKHIAFSPDGEFVAVGGEDECIYILSIVARTMVAKQNVPHGGVNGLRWHPVKNTLAYSNIPKNPKAARPVVWYYINQV